MVLELQFSLQEKWVSFGEGGGKEEMPKSGFTPLGSCFFQSKRLVGEQVDVT